MGVEGKDWSGVSMGEDCVEDHCEPCASSRRAGEARGARLGLTFISTSQSKSAFE